MSSKHRFAAILSLAVLLAACTTGGASGSVPPSLPIAVAPPPASAIVPPASPSAAAPSTGPSASPGGGGGASTAPNSIDPCTLLTQAEASTLMGKALNAGVSTTLDPDRVCTFQSGQSEVKLFLAPTAPDAKTADDYYDMARSQLPADVVVNDLNMFDRASYGGGSLLSAFFVVDGTNGFEVYCGFPGCSETASAFAATLIAGRLP